jgi:[ribosomal protein S5]-alanine N-acetyltransferase
MQIPVLETDRLHLRAFVPSDAAIVQTLAGAAEVAATTLNIEHPYPDGAAEAWICGVAERAGEGRALAWAIVNRLEVELIGAISIGLHSRHQRGELGYWLGVPSWNRRFMTEAAVAVVKHGFEALNMNDRGEKWWQEPHVTSKDSAGRT